MKERRERTWSEIREEMELGDAIRERFRMERHPEASVDGENPWDLDLFDDGDED